METKEWALILFTVLTQLAVGAFILNAWFRQRNQDGARDRIYRNVVWVLIPLVAVAILASLFHLGRPMVALNALRNLATSWLSREVFFTGAFFALLIATALTDRLVATRRLMEWLGSLAGLGAVISMAALYSRAMMPAWQGLNTHVAFAGTAVVLGSVVLAGLLILFARGTEPVKADLQVLMWAGVGALVIEAVAYPAYLTALGSGNKAAQAALTLLTDQYLWMVITRWALVLIGGLVPMFLFGRRIASGRGSAWMVYAGALFLMAGEVMGRFLFYISGVQITIG